MIKIGQDKMQQFKNQQIEINLNLPNRFGKCLGLERVDPNTLSIHNPKMTPQKELNASEIIEYITEYLPLSGSLVTDDRGFTYLDVVNEYIYELLPFIEAPGATNPPYFDSIYGAGAHVSVILASEAPSHLPTEIYNEEISFAITDCYFVQPENWIDIETLWFLTIDAPRLSEIRSSLNLSPKIQDREFHITFAVKRRFLSIHEILTHENKTIIIKDFLV